MLTLAVCSRCIMRPWFRRQPRKATASCTLCLEAAWRACGPALQVRCQHALFCSAAIATFFSMLDQHLLLHLTVRQSSEEALRSLHCQGIG